MDEALVVVAEVLAAEFTDEPTATVVRVVADCVDEFPNSDPMFVEQAARAQLRREGDSLRKPQRPRMPRPMTDLASAIDRRGRGLRRARPTRLPT